MRKISVFAHISLDGVISPGGPNEDSDYANGGWTAPYRTPTGAAAVSTKATSSGILMNIYRPVGSLRPERV